MNGNFVADYSTFKITVSRVSSNIKDLLISVRRDELFLILSLPISEQMFFLTVTIMGNEESHHPKIEVEEEAVEVTDNWSLHLARDISENVNVFSAFIGQPKLTQTNASRLERLAKNLMIHRHPCIVRYMYSWSKNARFYLITEEVQPLAVILSNQSALEICIGLHSILMAVIFLHEKAKASHNNICCASIYVTPEGIWKLGGLEYLKKFSDITASYLQESRMTRFERGVPPEEDSLLPNSKINAEAIDKFAFGVLAEELLKKKSTEEIPFLIDFRDYCKKTLQSSNADERPKLTEVLSHQFFNHDFIKISRFLFDLPLKTSIEKEQFFSDLTEQLSVLPEDVVGSQLASLLLSRVVLLDSTAQKHLLPVVLQPKMAEKQNEVALFSESVFKKYIIPKLLQIFCVRDAQIRLILLNHFHLFCNSFTEEQLKLQILPELLVGIKDIDDHLVSMTLKALSELVMILGAPTVVGGKRAKLFTDGRPKSQSTMSPGQNKQGVKDKTKQSPAKNGFYENNLPERPSPDGGEDNSSSATALEGEGDTETWSDWDAPNGKDSPKMNLEETTESPLPPAVSASANTEQKLSFNKSLPDITALDIKSNASDKINTEIDFFQDMEPVISKTQIVNVRSSSKTKFDVESDETESNWEGWGEDWEVGEVS